MLDEQSADVPHALPSPPQYAPESSVLSAKLVLRRTFLRGLQRVEAAHAERKNSSLVAPFYPVDHSPAAGRDTEFKPEDSHNLTFQHPTTKFWPEDMQRALT